MAHTNRRAVQDYDDGIFRLTATEPRCDHDEHLNKNWEDVLLFLPLLSSSCSIAVLMTTGSEGRFGRFPDHYFVIYTSAIKQATYLSEPVYPPLFHPFV
jgi:hypothetical protein